MKKGDKRIIDGEEYIFDGIDPAGGDNYYIFKAANKNNEWAQIDIREDALGEINEPK